MRAYLLPIALQVIGFTVVLAEVFIPSMGVLSVAAFGLVSYSLYLAWVTISPSAFWVFIGADLLVLPLVLLIGFKLLGKSSLSLHTELSSKAGVTSQAPDLISYLNKQGETITPLRPAGMAHIEGVRLDVVTNGDFIEANVPVQVTGVRGNQVIVARIKAFH